MKLDVDRFLAMADRVRELPADERRKLGEELLAEADAEPNERQARRMRWLAQSIIDSANKDGN